MTAAKSCWSGVQELHLQTVGLQIHNRMYQFQKAWSFVIFAFAHLLRCLYVIVAVPLPPKVDTYIFSQCIGHVLCESPNND